MSLIVQSGARQYFVTPNQNIIVDRVLGEVGTNVELKLIQALGDDSAVTQVFGKIIGHQRGEKIIVAKYKPKSNYHRRYGPRQEETVLEISVTSTEAAKPVKKVIAKKTPIAK